MGWLFFFLGIVVTAIIGNLVHPGWALPFFVAGVFSWYVGAAYSDQSEEFPRMARLSSPLTGAGIALVAVGVIILGSSIIVAIFSGTDDGCATEVGRFGAYSSC